MQQLLEDKVAVVYGAGGIGTAMAKAFAAAGATVHLGNHTAARLDAAKREIAEDGSSVHTAIVDALDPTSVRAHVDAVTAASGRIDVAVNVIGHGDVHGTPLIDMDLEDFARPIESAIRSTFLTSQACGKKMVQQGGGVILMFGGEDDPMDGYDIGGTLVAFGAQETMRRQLACELGSKGVRVVTIISGGIPDTIGDDDDPSIAKGIVDATMIGRAADYEDVGNVAVFVASDQARMMTAATVNISGGCVID
jgi:NAD(P)-dependent dehydrogenase (short-subunit alcohol dehydrogenase family)